MTDYFTVDPAEVIRFDRSDVELQVFWLFCGCVAGKTASTQARLLANFLHSLPECATPFDSILKTALRGELLNLIKASRLGQYNRLWKFMVESATTRLDLRNCSVEDLERIPGCGPKTARMFLMFSRPNQRFAALDTHVLKHLRANGIQAVPKTTPPAGKTYRRLEAEFLKLADASGLSVADYDLQVWKLYSGHAD